MQGVVDIVRTLAFIVSETGRNVKILYKEWHDKNLNFQQTHHVFCPQNKLKPGMGEEKETDQMEVI